MDLNSERSQQRMPLDIIVTQALTSLRSRHGMYALIHSFIHLYIHKYIWYSVHICIHTLHASTNTYMHRLVAALYEQAEMSEEYKQLKT